MNTNTPFELNNCIALITGSSRGIGKAIAKDFAKSGAEVIVTGRTIEAAKVVTDEIRENGGQANPFAYDASNLNGWNELVSYTKQKYRRLDILVNNAAVLRPHIITKLSEQEFDDIFHINVRSALFLTKGCLTLLEQSKQAAVVNITAAGARRPLVGIGAYCASKAALVNLTRTLAKEWMRKGIRVNALTPGSVATDMILPADPTKRTEFEKNMARENLMNRLAEPIEIARAVRFLASPAASFITGEELVVDGGYLA